MASAVSSSNKVTLICSEGVAFELEVDEAVAAMSPTIMLMKADDVDISGAGIPIPNVSSNIMSKVIDYCTKHVNAVDGLDFDNWDANFVDVDQLTLNELILAANFFDIKGLLDLTCRALADRIKRMSPEEVRSMFNIKNDYSPAEEEEIRREHAWAFE